MGSLRLADTQLFGLCPRHFGTPRVERVLEFGQPGAQLDQPVVMRLAGSNQGRHASIISNAKYPAPGLRGAEAGGMIAA